MRLLLQHRSRYVYPTPAQLGSHTLRMQPAPHARARIEAFRLLVSPHQRLRSYSDPYGNRLARVDFDAEAPTTRLEILVEIALQADPVNPFDFLLEPIAERVPFAYPSALGRELAPFLALDDPAFATGPLFEALDTELPRAGATLPLLDELNRTVNARVRYVIREEPGVFTPEESLSQGRASCRDSAVLLAALLRRRGLAARFVSGYLIQLADEGMLPDQPRGVARDVADLHAWCEVYLPGAGWVGLDATSGLFCGEGHLPLCCAASPALAAPLDGTSDVGASEVQFSLTVQRLGHEARPTMPYTDEVWAALREGGTAVDDRLLERGVRLTMGGEPTFNARTNTDAPEWNGAALGPHKWEAGLRLARELHLRLSPGGATLHRYGKWYPGESLPRWALDLIGRADGKPIWSDRAIDTGTATVEDARRFAETLARRLGLPSGLHAAYEDPWQLIKDEAALPAELDARRASLDDPEERRRVARQLGRGVGTVAGWVLPIAPAADGEGWLTERWQLRREALYLLPGDSALGLRLPLGSLSPGPSLEIEEQAYSPPDPRRPEQAHERDSSGAQRALVSGGVPASGSARVGEGLATAPPRIRTALCVEPREGRLWVFLPPLPSFQRFCQLVRIVDDTRVETGLGCALEGYPPPPSPEARRIAVTPDPGVLEVNLPPTSSMAEYEVLVERVFDAALHAGLHAEKYLVDGRMAGSGGGNHITLGGAAPLESPFLKQPALLGSLLGFVQHHPSLSYLFSGLFVGPTSQAPRIDEARHDAVYELEIALERAFRADAPPPWLCDLLFRHLLTDVTGNTHRTEISIDKLFDPATSFGRQGLVELRAFEMPPHPRMVYAQMLLVRALIAAFATAPYQVRLKRWGQALHDRFLLPHFLWRDLEDVLGFLSLRGLVLPTEGYRPFLELRCPLVGRMSAGDVTLEVRNAIEPWNVLGEEITTTGTSRYVDSSMERIEVRAHGLDRDRHAVLVNGVRLPLHATGEAGGYVAGVRFRAWAPAHSLHAHLGTHHPIHLDLVDTWAERSLGGCAYHVWHPEGRAFDEPPLTRFEAAARRAQRFTLDGPSPWPVRIVETQPHPDAPLTLDLRRLPIDAPPEWSVPSRSASEESA